MAHKLFTIGHSSRSLEELVSSLHAHSITAVCDVRSAPYSKYKPHFTRDVFADSLKQEGIDYVYLGRELGGRPSDPACYCDGRVQYDLVMQTDAFRGGIRRLQEGLKSYRIALMCAERDPITCHRMILVCHYLRSADCEIVHIIDSAHPETQHDSERRLLRLVGIPEKDLFSGFDEMVEDAYCIQANRIAYRADAEAAVHGKET
ncbi:MAG: DUF488 domain-containing protein [Planctomycetota bacterium]|nr:DUF488 domain-containing protein [Planctomycetota bacterium]